MPSASSLSRNRLHRLLLSFSLLALAPAGALFPGGAERLLAAPCPVTFVDTSDWLSLGGSCCTWTYARPVVSNGYVYAGFEDTLAVLKLSTGGLLQVVDQWQFDADVDALAVDGSLLLVSTGGVVEIYDVQTPASPRLLDAIGFDFLPLDIAVSDGMAYLVGSNRVEILNIRNPRSAVWAGGFTAEPWRWFDRGVLSGTHLFLSGLFVLDVATPAHPARVFPLSSGTGNGDDNPLGPVSGGYLYTLNLDNLVKVFDVSRPASPVQVGSWHLSSGTTHGGAVSGTLVYLARGTELIVVDFLNPAAPVQVATYQTTNPSGYAGYHLHKLAVTGDLAVLQDGPVLETVRTACALRWVALGDSYSSGEGVGWYSQETDTENSNLCHRSNGAYSQINGFLGSSSEFFACSGATTYNVLPSSGGGFPQTLQNSSTQRSQIYATPDDVPQLDRANLAGADLVTITIGGNDVGFGSILSWCVEEADCREHRPFLYVTWTLRDWVALSLAQAQANLNLALAEIRNEAGPDADIRVLGYPRLFPGALEDQSCAQLADVCLFETEGGFSPDEQNWLNDLAPLLNAAVERAATAVGARFIPVDQQGRFGNHEICGPEGSWITDPCFGWNGTFTKQEMFHPTWQGQLWGYRAALEADLKAFPLGAGRASGKAAPTAASLAELRAAVATAKGTNPESVTLRAALVSGACGTTKAIPGSVIAVGAEGYAPGSTVTLTLVGAQSQLLRTVAATAAGEIATSVTIPAGTTPSAFLRLEARGTGATGLERLATAHLGLAPSLTVDQDADGVADACDVCPTVANSSQSDSDGDGLGNACDTCASDPENDADGDGLCGNTDLFPYDRQNDADQDGVGGNLDNCPAAPNRDQADADGDGAGDACDVCPGHSDVVCFFGDGLETGTADRWTWTRGRERTARFSTTTAVAAPASGTTVGAASPYPSTVSVQGMPGAVSRLTVTLDGLSHTWPDDLDVLLVAPNGDRVMLMSDACGSQDLTGVSLSFSEFDFPAGDYPVLPDADPCTAGLYFPTDWDATENLPAPAPARPYAGEVSAFVGDDPNGTWALYVYDDVSGDTGALGGWTLEITTEY